VGWIDADVAPVAVAAMLSPTTLSFSISTLVVSERPLRSGFWFYAGALTATLGIGVVAAFVLGDAAATSDPSTPRTWVAVVSLLPFALALLLLLVVPAWTMRVLGRARGCLKLHARTIAAVFFVALAVTLERNGLVGLAA
jgi:hypothetical protein